MNEIVNFLNSHSEIVNIAIIQELPFKYRDIEKYVINTNVKHIVLSGYDLRDSAENVIQKYTTAIKYGKISNVKIEYIELDDFSGFESEWALCSEKISASFLLKLSTLNSKYVLAQVREETVTSFHLWEAFRNNLNLDILQIVTERKDKDPQVLCWNRNFSTEIELSIVFPMYNVEKYLDQCIESVTAWKAPYVEFLFVNDGSPDNSRDVVLKWSKVDSRVKLLDKENGGCASAREFGLEQAKGKYVGFVDPDDFVDESMFRKLLKAAMIGSYDISYCGYNEYYENTGETNKVEDAIYTPWCDGVHDQHIIWDLINWCRVAIWRGIYRKEFLQESNIHFYTDLRRFDDLPFKIETFANAKSVISVPENLYYYRLARPGQDVAADDERLYVHFDIFKYLNESIAGKKDLALNDKLEMAKIDTHLYAIQKIRPEFMQYYIQQAKTDLESISNFNRFYPIVKILMGKEKAESYKRIIDNDYKYFLEKKNKD